VAREGDAELAAALERQGAEVLAVAADPADGAALADALTQVEARFASIDTLVFSADPGPLAGLAAIAEWTPEWTAQLAAFEAQHDVLAGALEGRTIGRVLLESSLASVLGSVARVRVAAANALTDGFAAAHRWTSVGWDAWNAGDAETPGITPDEVPAALRAALALAGEAHVLVSTTDVEARIRTASATVALPDESAAPLYERPEGLAVDYHAPTSEVEETLAELWQGLLGIDRVGIHDDFFGLGGHSLLATQIVARVRDLFELSLPLQAIFEAPTIARFAELIEDAIIAELEGLSEEEAAGIMGQG
jgi:acyl carrier protein